jgi:hypothetical protein
MDYIILLIFVSITILVYYFAKQQKCPKPTIQYKYIPRTFEQEQDDPTYVSEILGNMFIEPTPWIIGQSGNRIKKIN